MSLRSRFTFPIVSVALFLLLAIAHTWPLITEPAGLSRNDTHDTVHHRWILAWDAHAIATEPLNLFNTNTFYPERDTLASSDHIIVQGLIGAPLSGPALAGARLQPRADLRPRGHRLDDEPGRERMDRQSPGRTAQWLAMALGRTTLTRFAEIQDQYLGFARPLGVRSVAHDPANQCQSGTWRGGSRSRR